MEYILEKTQNHISTLGVESPTTSGDSRYVDIMKYPFIDYDILINEVESK
jgi:hypothetical protein